MQPNKRAFSPLRTRSRLTFAESSATQLPQPTTAPHDITCYCCLGPPYADSVIAESSLNLDQKTTSPTRPHARTMCEFIRGSTHACGHPRTRTITQRCAASLASGVRCAVPKPELTGTRCHDCQDTIQRTASWGDVQKALREQSEASFASSSNGRDSGLGLGFGHGRSKSDGSLALGMQQGAGGMTMAKTEGGHAVTASVDSGVVMAENERPERQMDLPEIVVSTPHGSREKAGRDEGVGTDGRRGT